MRASLSGGGRVLRAASVCALAVLLSISSVPMSASALTATTITIDGDLTDWTGVRADPDNSSRDTQISDPDPDYPGQPDRDVYLVNATWDSQFLYLAFRRTSGGTKAIVFAAYIDRQGDGLLQGNGGNVLEAGDDAVVTWKVSQGDTGRFADAHAPSPTARILTYNQAIDGKNGPYIHPGGDPMGYDGETPDGWADVQSGDVAPLAPMDGWLADNGIEFEGRVAWSDLGLAPGSLVALHFIDANGESFGVKWVPSTTHKWTGQPPQYLEENRGQVEDNVNDIWWLRERGVDIAPDNAGGGGANETVYYTHTVTNTSNASDTIDLAASSSLGWGLSITDLFGNALSSVTLGAGASATVRVAVAIPDGTADGTRDLTTVTATSRTDPTVTDTATDATTAGRVTVTADQVASMAPGHTVDYTFTVQNNLPSSGTFDLTRLSSLGFPYTITDLAGNPLSSVALASAASTEVVVHVSVPSTATIGSQDVTRLTASLQGAPAIRSSATGTTLVRAGLTIAPDNASVGGPGGVIDYRHTVTNSWPATRSFDLTATTTLGWPVTFYAADGVTRITSMTLGPDGAAAEIVARVAIPGDAVGDSTDVATVRVLPRDGTAAVSATDTTTVRILALYDSAGYVNQTDGFALLDTAYARGMGLDPASQVTFVWKDPNGLIVRTSPLRTVDTAGMAFDELAFSATALTGGWILEMYDSRGNLLETSPFTVRWKAEITELVASDAPSVGSDVSVTSSVANRIGSPIEDSVMTYVMWWDENGDGVFGSGDTYIDSTGTPHPWDGVTPVSTHVTSGIDVPGDGTWSDAAWTVNNRDFPHQGDYKVTATWTELDGTPIDATTVEFYSIPALGWPLFLVAFGGAVLLVRRRTQAGEVAA